jgi:type IV secretory pathway VirB10-like protein
MATNLPGTTNKQPHGVSHAFMIAIGALIFGVVAGFFFSHRGTPPQPYNPADFAMSGVNPNWYKGPYTLPPPSAAPTPAPAAPLAAPAAMPAQVYRASAAATPDMAAQERARSLMRAMSSDLEVKVAGANVLDMPSHTAQRLTVSTNPAPPHTLTAWNYLYAVLETGISSDHPGDVIARLSQDARDSVTQTEILIPMGSKLHGIERGSGQVGINDKGIIVVWDDLTLPNGGHVPLPRLPAADAQGYPGLTDEVDRHLAATWGPALLISGITAGAMLAQRPTFGSYQGYDATQQASGAFASSLGSRATQTLGSELLVNRPTIVVRPGTPFRVLLTRDLTFSGPYGG